jgi:hypothetical protein
MQLWGLWAVGRRCLISWLALQLWRWPQYTPPKRCAKSYLTTRRHIPEGSTVRTLRCENLTSTKKFKLVEEIAVEGRLNTTKQGHKRGWGTTKRTATEHLSCKLMIKMLAPQHWPRPHHTGIWMVTLHTTNLENKSSIRCLHEENAQNY